jgi:hypothetical protein
VSILVGFAVLGALGRELKATDDAADLDIYKWNVRGSALSQQLIFAVAVGLFALFVALNMPRAASYSLPASTVVSGPVTVTGTTTLRGL